MTTTVAVVLPAEVASSPERLKAAADALKAQIGEDATLLLLLDGEAGAAVVVVVSTVAEVKGALTVSKDVTAEEKADVLNGIEVVACAGVATTDCSAAWSSKEEPNDEGGRLRRRRG